MTAADVISGFREGTIESAGQAAYANVLFQEAIRLGMELNDDPIFRLFPPSYTDFDGVPARPIKKISPKTARVSA